MHPTYVVSHSLPHTHLVAPVQRSLCSIPKISNLKRPMRSSATSSNAVSGPPRLLSRTLNRICRPGSARPVPTTKQSTYDLDRNLAERLQFEELEIATRALTIANQLQNQYDSENQQLHWQTTELTSCTQNTFHCGICFDEQPEDDAATVDDCSHTMCRSCLRDFVCSKIQEHRFPILCPICTAVDKNPNPAVISRLLVEQIGVTEEQFQVWTEMELAEVSVFIQCRECSGSAFVDREDLEETTLILCPEQDCYHVWCKECQQTIDPDGPEHSCDGSSELDNLMKEQGWKYCPSCRTPIQKGAGCNHMTCISPGCNSHFCYVCGGLIVQSAVKTEIDTAVSTHYNRCQLFDDSD